MKRSHFTASTVAFGSIAIVARPAAADPKWVYKYGSNLPVEHPLNVRARQMFDSIQKDTGGRLVVRMFPDSALGGDTAMLTQLRSGALEFQMLDGVIMQSIVPVAAIQGVGFAYRDSAQALTAFDGSLGTYIRSQIETKNIHCFEKIWENGMRQITSSKGPIRDADDLAGFKIRLPPGKIFVDLFKSLGASPIALNFSETYTALQTKLVDGMENSYLVIESSKIYEVQKYLSVTNHIWGALWLLAGGEAWAALPADVQAIVERHAREAALLERRDVAILNATLQDKLHRRGLAINVADTKSMRARLGTFYAERKAEFGAVAWDQLERAVGKLT